MNDPEQRWRGFNPEVEPGPSPGHFAVKFYTQGLMSRRGPGGDAPEVPLPPTVYLEGEHCGNLQVVGYIAARTMFPDLEQSDFEQRAVDLVRQTIAAELA